MNLIKSHIALLTGLLTCLCNAAFAQNAYIKTEIIKASGVTNDAGVDALNYSGKQTTYTYLNGLGTPVQNVAYQEATNTQDIVQVYQNDQFGNTSTSYLPYVDDNNNNASGSYRITALTDQQNYYSNNSTPGNLNKVANDLLPFSQQLFENSPLRRLLASGSVGAGFQPDLQDNSQHYTTVGYRNNTSADNVMETPTTSNTLFYLPNTLMVNDTKNADGVETLIFKNTAGQTILKRQISGQLSEPNYDTYYVYNHNGSVAYILPPKASKILATGGTQANVGTLPLRSLIYAYTYDQLGRIITRKVPNEDTVSIVYDLKNRPILVQDGNKSLTNQWIYIKYDAANRAICYGTYTDPANIGQANMQSFVNSTYGVNFYETRSSNQTSGFYTDQVFPLNGVPLSFAYYDNYDILQSGSPLYSYTPQGLVNQFGTNIDPIQANYAQGMLTMVADYTVTSGTMAYWLNKVFFYDKHHNLIQTKSNNHLNYQLGVLTDTRTVAPDFTGKPLQTKVTKVTSATNTVLTTFNYDYHDEKVQSITQQYNNQPAVTTATYAYNELGQMVTKQLGYNATTAAYLQTLDYRFNIRGQLLTVNNSTLTNDGGVTNNDYNDLFGMTYLYDGTDPNLAHDKPSYTGNISAVKWSYKYNSGASTSNERSYVYAYDNLGQLKSALYAERQSGGSSFNSNIDGFDEKSIVYDDDGNIQGLQRYSSTTNGTGGTYLDRLMYTYDPNNPDRLFQVADTASAVTSIYGFNDTYNHSQAKHYKYDASGNLVYDPYKNLTIEYNTLNKTDAITITGNGSTTSTINYVYDASGTVLRKQVYQNGVLQSALSMDYIDEFIYVNGALSSIGMPEGRAVSSGTTFIPEYIITDQQGNARFSFQDSGSGTPKIIQENSYYAFGEAMPGSLVLSQPNAPASNLSLYNGNSEWQNTLGNLPDYYQTGSRNYDPELGRFVAVDPIAEVTESLTNYHYAGNNPIMLNDPSGNDPGCDPTTDAGCPLGSEYDPEPYDPPPFYTPDYDTGGGGGGDPDGNYGDGLNAPASTGSGGTYNNTGITWHKYTLTIGGTTYTHGDNIQFSTPTRTYVYYRYQLSIEPQGIDLSSIGLPSTGSLPTSIPAADVTTGPSADSGEGTSSSGEASQEEEEPAWGSTSTLTSPNFTDDINNGVINTHIEGYNGKVIGKEGKYGTLEFDDSFHPAYSGKLGFLGAEVADDEASINFSFGKGTYKFGLSKNGIYEDDSYTNKGLINGMRYTYSVDPKGAIILGGFSAAATYILNVVSEAWQGLQESGL